MMDAKLMMIQTPRTVSEDNLTQTPRSHLNSDGCTYGDQSPNSNSPLGSHLGSKCEDEFDADQESLSDDDDEGQDAYHDQDEYDAFLREMAGSFEATNEDDEDSEVGSDSAGSSDEDEGDKLVGRKRSSWSYDDPADDLTTSPRFVGRGRALGAGSPEEEEQMKASGSKAEQCTSAQPQRGGYPANMTARIGEPRQGLLQAVGLQAVCGRRVSMPPPTRSDTNQGATPSRASLDRRAPVVDDYDVVKATVEFAEQRGQSVERQREDLVEAIKLRSNQATNLAAPSRKQHRDPELRSHYARVRSELLTEVRALEEQLKALEAQQQQPAAPCSQAEVAQAMMAHQETSFGGQAPSVVVN
jgi:hypothetical protein